MKKALSVLLVAAALFGFYGSAVTVNDLLACKDYWEEAGEKSTADMNKLEDGLNQLLENEEAYLDGIDQVAEGEATLAQGEADYAAGQKELADGEATYAAAGPQLADARKKLADAEDLLAEGREQLNGLTTLINYLSDVEAKYNAWKSKYEALNKDRKDVADAVTDDVKDDLLTVFKPAIQQAMGAAVAQRFEYAVIALNENDASTLAQESKDTAKESIGFMNAAYSVAGAITTVQDNVQENIDTVSGMSKSIGEYLDDSDDKLIGFINDNATQINGFTGDAVKTYVQQFAEKETLDDDLKAAATAIKGALDFAKNTMEATYIEVDDINTAKAKMFQFFQKYSNGETDPETGNFLSGIIKDELAGADGGEGYMATVMQGVAKNVLGNKTLKDNVEAKMGAQGISLLNYLKSDSLFPKSDDYPTGATFGAFAYQMETNPAILGALKQAKNLLVSARADGQDTYNKGLKDYKDGKALYNKKNAEYKAAPAKLAAGRQALAEGLEQLMDGRKQLEDGKAQLAQYEDGEQQVRDGLATLFNTEPDLELESIADRLGGDGDFDNGDAHLDIDEGLNAVEVGRGYQAEDGDLITAEIMGRAVATGGLLAAGVLAVLAAILSFLKKNKGAAVFAILAAAAGAFGAFYGPAQGTYFSDIAGSTVGTTTWVAAGVLGAVALVHAIAHFAAPKNA